MSELKKMTLTLRVEVPLDESMLDVAGFRSLWEEIDGLCDTCRGFGELVHFSVEDLPDRIVLADTRPSRSETMEAHIRAAMRKGGS